MNSIQYFTKALLGIALLIAIMPTDVLAQRSVIAYDSDAEIIPRVVTTETDITITNNDNSVDLMIVDDMIVVQFTSAFLNKVSEEIKESEKSTRSSYLEDVIRAMVSSGVRTLLDRALAIPFSEIVSVTYENGAIKIVNINGNVIFEEFEINDIYVMEDFSRRDARRFVEEANKRLP